MGDGLCKGKSGGRGTSREAAAKVRPDIVASAEVVQMEVGGHRAWFCLGGRIDNICCRPGCKVGRGKKQNNQLLGFWFEQVRV